jgi:hypothetical protein
MHLKLQLRQFLFDFIKRFATETFKVTQFGVIKREQVLYGVDVIIDEGISGTSAEI